MYPQDVAELFPMVPVGTPVRLINQPIKVAWLDGELLLEAHPPVDDEGQSFEPDVDRFAQLLQTAVGDSTVAIDWDYAREVLKRADGVLATVGIEADLSGVNDAPGPPPQAPSAEAPAAAPATAPATAQTPTSAVAASHASAADARNR